MANRQPPTRLMRVEEDTHRKIRVVSRADRRTLTRELAHVVDAGLEALGYPTDADELEKSHPESHAQAG